MEVALINYGAGNVKSVSYAFERLGVTPNLTANAEEILKADYVIFPGVGQAAHAMNALKKKGLDELIPNLTQPVLGICLGMQLMCNFSAEGNVNGLGIFDTAVERFEPTVKVPHTGWNSIAFESHPLFKKIDQKAYVYFVHSYFMNKTKNTVATTNYGKPFSAAIQKNNFYGCQFHPEKSGAVGNQILQNFLTL